MTQEEKELINKLNEKQTYFEAILALSQSQDISQKKAWRIIEAQREEIGLKQKYKSFDSFRACKHLFYKRLEENKRHAVRSSNTICEDF